MGNTLNTTELTTLQKQRGTLDLRLHVNYEQYCQHALGLAPHGSLTNLSTSLPATPSLHSGLNASFNWLSDIPLCLPERLPHLVTLDLSHNRLASIADAILLALPHLRDISLSNNLLQTLPESTHLLPKLTRLDCSHNAIEVLPSALGLCPALRALNCSHNRLKQLPITLGKSQTIQLLLATGNPCTSPPKDVCEKGSGETLNYLRAVAHGLDPNSPNPGPNIQEDARPRKLVFPRALGGTLGVPVVGGAAGSGGCTGGKEQFMEMQQGGRQVGMQTAVGLRTPLFPPPGSTTLDALELRDRIAGLLFGAAIGDSIGLATEFLSHDECMFHYCPLGKTTSTDGGTTVLPLLRHNRIIRDGHRVRWRRGDWTSHSDIMLLVLDSIIHWGGVVDELDFALRLKTWSETQATGEPGEGKQEAVAAGLKGTSEGKSHISSPIIRKVVSKPNFSSFPHDAALAVWKEAIQSTASNKLASEECTSLDNGSLPQSIVLGVPHFYNLSEVLSNSSRICLTLHQDPACVAASVATSVIVAELLQGRLASGTKGEADNGSTVDVIFRSARDAAWPHLKDCSTKVQSAFDACFWPHSQAELETLVIEEVHHPFTTLSIAAQVLRDDCKATPSTTATPPLSSPHQHQSWCTATKTAAGDASWFPAAECCCNGERWGEGTEARGGAGVAPSAYECGLSRVAQLCGHASANCCLSGALLGCVHGFSSLPSHWVEEGLHSAKRALLTGRINALLNLMALP